METLFPAYTNYMINKANSAELLTSIKNYSAKSTQNNTSAWMMSPYTQHINWQLSTLQPAHTTPPPPLG